ncbi:hypothetical protein HWV07_16540 [Natronomonas salina]|uniref:hypothetical protein n=1 Tax=Natronomonas salina TaxID=1710540 RepID=UPI0015B631CF|nr:hypothetical protein [Natronomonas salina]QLD90557.1 hypothetical protein HWV07_16540 [Natronomonas salina]
MVELRFTDPHGRTGRISESLEVDYEGQWEEEVSRGLERIKADAGPGEPDDPLDEVYTLIVLELPDETPIIEVERTDDPVRAGPIER